MNDSLIFDIAAVKTNAVFAEYYSVSPLQHPLVIALVVGVLLALIFVWQGKRHAMSPAQFFLYLANLLLTRFMWGLKVKGKFPIEHMKSGCLIVANHRSSADPMVLQAALTLPIKWMIAREYCENWTIGWILRIIGVIPVTRAAVDRTSAKLAIQELRSGSWIGIFPEGKINVTDELLLPARTGIALLALRAGVPVVPCFIEDAPYKGSVAGAFFMRAKVTLNIGEPIYFDERENGPTEGAGSATSIGESGVVFDEPVAINTSQESGRQKRGDRYSEATLRIMQAMAKISPQPDFQPTVHARGNGDKSETDGSS